MSQQFENLTTLLKALFQLDRPDLDFGFYRIMHAKSEEITQFLEHDLFPQIQEALSQYKSADKAKLEQELAEAVAQAHKLGADPDTLPKVLDLRRRIDEEAVDLNALEAEVYDHLYSFFRRYYSEGDFLGKRVYKPGVYAVPYEGEEVKLHWANADQYYIKTDEYLRNYTFRLRPEDQDDPMRVHFRLVDAAEGEHDNVKADENKKRVFLLTDEDFIAEVPGETGPELAIHFEYRLATVADWPEAERAGKSKSPAQKDLITLAEKRILAVSNADITRWIKALKESHVTANGEIADYSRLRAHLNRYTARNTFDYFIHKDLGSFLRRELDFFIKNEVMHLDDVENETAPRVEQYLSKIKVIRRIAGKIIEFMAQLEGFQKKLWLKKKFVVETSWCIRVGCIPETFYAEIVENQAQHGEWVELLAIDEIKCDKTTPAYSKKLKPEFLRGNPTLVVDTRHFDGAFTARLLEAMGDIDEQSDGVLFHSENFQAISAMQARYRDQLEYVYLDPPFNTTDVGFAYKNEYRHSSWLAMVTQTFNRTDALLRKHGLISIAIDDAEVFNLGSAIDEIIAGERRIGVLIVEIKPSGRTNDKFLSTSHEYYLWYGKDPGQVDICFFDLADDAAEAYSETDVTGNFKWRDFLRTGGYSTPVERPNSFYYIYYRESDGYIGTQPVEGAVEILPLDSSGKQRVWRKTPPSFLRHVEAGDIKVEKSRGGTMKVRIKDRIKDGVRPKSVWIGPKYDAASHGTKLLQSILGGNGSFPYPKSLNAVFDAVWIATKDSSEAQVLDYFAGSGTTGHAVINLNRRDGGQRKFILVEMGDYFDTVLLPRLKKVIYSPDWKDGKPKCFKCFATTEEAKRSPRILKVVRLESYEDTLNNLTPKRTPVQQDALDLSEANGSNSFKEQYLLRYMLDVETRGSQSLLNIDGFLDPTSYRLKVKRPGSDESRETNVDLLETFNWLLGLKVQRIFAPRTCDANFRRDDEGRLQLDGCLKEPADGPWWFRAVSGVLPDERRALILWRKRPGGETPEGMEEDNLVLEEWFKAQRFTENASYDLIYVNGVCQLETLKAPSDAWEVRLIEDAFRRLMFESEEV